MNNCTLIQQKKKMKICERMKKKKCETMWNNDNSNDTQAIENKMQHTGINYNVIKEGWNEWPHLTKI